MAKPLRILFVCTGNLCRSPMAEAIARARWAGPVFQSAGVYGLEDHPASEHAVAACGEIGVDLSGHRARRLSADWAASFDRIYVMTDDQLAQVMAIAPWAASRTDLLDPAGVEIGDPYGLSLVDYRRARDQIVAALEARAGEWS